MGYKEEEISPIQRQTTQIMSEMVLAAETLANIGPAISLFGSARIKPESEHYQKSEKIAQLLAKAGFSVIAGGGPGIMEAANRGAFEAGDKTIGFNISLPREQHPNPYVSPGLSFRFHYFALRKMHFMLRARAIVAFPGGFGSFDELFEVLTLMQTKKVERFPVILVGKAFWAQMIHFEQMIEFGVIDEEDMKMIHFAETAEQTWKIIQDHYQLT